jgi:GT2 family glycosyltransferase
VQGFSEGFFLYHEEMELCYRLRKQGWEVWLEPRARVVHHEAQASGVRRFRLPPMPVLGYRLQGMDYFWATHHPGLPHIIWRSMACFLIRLRAVLLRIAGCFAGKTVRTRLSDRATELNQAARELKEKKQGLDS